MLKYAHEPFCWDSNYTIPQFEFRFSFKLPPPRKARLILQRDESGRIIRSAVV